MRSDIKISLRQELIMEHGCSGKGEVSRREALAAYGAPMKQTIPRVICAVGQSGQMGLKGHLPWEGDRSPEYKADVARFFEITRGQVLAAGPKTISSVPEFARSDRDLFVLRSSMGPEELFKRFAGRIVFIGGVVIPPHPQQEMPLRRLFMCLSPSSWR